MVLLMVLVVVAMLALGGYTFVQLMNAEAKGAESYGRMLQARAAADSAVHYVAAVLSDQKKSAVLGTDLYDSATTFHGIMVGDEEVTLRRLRSRFSVVAAFQDSSGAALRYGLFDEAGRINLQAVAGWESSSPASGGSSSSGSSATDPETGSTNPLLYLPNITPEIADAILDWIDADDEPRPDGAESDYYQSLDPPYTARNGPLTAIDELLLVRGMTPRLLFGEDANQNGWLDPNEDDGTRSYPDDDSNGTLDTGWLPFLTLYSREPNTDALGAPRINLNDDDLESLFGELAEDADFGEDRARFIVAYRLFGPASSQRSSGGAPEGGSEAQSANASPESGAEAQTGSGDSGAAAQTIAGMDASGGAQFTIQSVVDLIGITVDVRYPGQEQATSLASPYQDAEMADYLETLLDRTTTQTATERVGSIHVNSAPLPVLMALPGMTEELADAILAGQPGDQSPVGMSWLLTGAALTKEQFKTIEPFITGRSYVYRLQAVGYFEEAGPVARVEAVIDMSGQSPQVRLWRELTPLGRGYDPQLLTATGL